MLLWCRTQEDTRVKLTKAEHDYFQTREQLLASQASAQTLYARCNQLKEQLDKVQAEVRLMLAVRDKVIRVLYCVL